MATCCSVADVDTPRAPLVAGRFATGAICEPHFKKLSQCTAVYRNFPADALEKIAFICPDSGTLVSEFWYNDNGDIHYNQPSDESLYKYARLITKSSVYQDIGQAMIDNALILSTLTAQFHYALNVMSHAGTKTLKTWWSSAILLAYPALLIIKVLLWFVLALHRARYKLKGDQLVRDFVWEANAVSDVKTMFFTWFFHLFNVPYSLTDVSSLLHVAKTVQPYAVFRAGFHRAWVLGWPTKEQYDVENQPGSLVMLPVSIVFELPLVVIQIMLAEDGLKITFSTVFTLVMSGLSLLSNLYYLVMYLKARDGFYRTIKSRVMKRGGTEEWLQQCEEEEADQLMIDYKLLRTYFNERMPHHVFRKAVSDGWLPDNTPQVESAGSP